MDVLATLTSRERRNLKEGGTGDKHTLTQEEFLYKIIHDLQADNRRLQDENYKLRESIIQLHSSSGTPPSQAIKLKVGRTHNASSSSGGEYYVSGRVL